MTAFLVDHAPVEPAFGYRFDQIEKNYSGKTIGIVESPNVRSLSKGSRENCRSPQTNVKGVASMVISGDTQPRRKSNPLRQKRRRPNPRSLSPPNHCTQRYRLRHRTMVHALAIPPKPKPGRRKRQRKTPGPDSPGSRIAPATPTPNTSNPKPPNPFHGKNNRRPRSPMRIDIPRGEESIAKIK